MTEWNLQAARPLDLPPAETPQDALPPVPRDEWDEGVGETMALVRVRRAEYL